MLSELHKVTHAETSPVLRVLENANKQYAASTLTENLHIIFRKLNGSKFPIDLNPVNLKDEISFSVHLFDLSEWVWREALFNFAGWSCSAVAVWDAHTPGAGADETDGPFMLKAGR